MVNRLTKHKSIKVLLKKLSLASILALLIIATGLCLVSYLVWSKVDQVVEGRLQQTVGDSYNSRDFGMLHSRIRVFQTTFYGNNSLLEEEGERLQRDLDLILSRVTDPQLETLLKRLSSQLNDYFDRGRWINVLLDWRTDQDNDLNDLLQVLQELISERTISVALKGGDTSYFEQLMMLISGYRETLLEVGRLNAEENHQEIMSLRTDDPPPLTDELEGLTLRLRTLTASEPTISRFGSHLISRVNYYKYLMRLYQLEMIHLNEQDADLNLLVKQIIGAMEQIDHRSAVHALETREAIGQMMFLMIVSVLVMLVVMGIVTWNVYRRLFQNHIQRPMDQVGHRLTDFQNGDHSTPMALGREDEWREIEEIFNSTLSALQENVAALQQSEKRYREIFNNATEGIFRSTLDGQFIELNPSAVSMLGFSSAEDAINHYSDLGQQLYAESEVRKKMVDTLLGQGTNLNFEVVMQRQSGEQFWCSINNYLIRNELGKPLYIEGTINDISENKLAQESLQQAKINMQNIIDSMPSVLIGLNRDLEVTLWNKRAEQESILTADEAAGRTMMDVCRLFKPEVYLEHLRETIETQQPSRLLKIESVKKAADGGSRFFDILIYPISSETSRGAVLHMDDVTERVRFETRMVQSEKMQSIGSLASGLAHEINNPLAAILQNVQVLSRRLSTDLKQNVETAETLGTSMDVIAQYVQERGCEKMLRSITEAGQRAAAIVANMQSFSRHNTGGFTACALPELIEKTLELAGSDYDMRYHYDFQKIAVKMNFQEVPKISCEASHIQQVLLRLFKNAAQAMTGQTQDPCLEVRLSIADDSHVCIRVEDNGPGMDEEISSRIFDPFYTTQEVGQGSGLGLSIAYFIVTQMHKGSLTVASVPGQGTQFDILLPIAQE